MIWEYATDRYFYFFILLCSYEVAPRSDSEESGSEFDEEVSGFPMNMHLHECFLTSHLLKHNILRVKFAH